MAKSWPKQHFFGFRGGWLTFWITVACATDMTLFGYDQGVFSGVVVTQDFLKLHNLVGPTKTNLLDTVTAILRYRKAILLGMVIMSIGTVIKVSSYSFQQMIVGRIVLGIGNGINTATAPIWQTETAQAKWRGKLVILEMAMNIAGFCLVNWINYGLSFVEGSVAWRFPLAFQFVFIFVLFATVPGFPSHHVGSSRMYSVNYEREHTIKWKDILLKRNKDTADTKTLRRLLLGANTQLMQQFGGINIMSDYMPTVLINSVGLTESMARLLSACNAVSYLIFSSAAVFLVERWGRRGLMLLSTAGQLLSFLVITILLRYAVGDKKEVLGSASIAFFFFYFISFGVALATGTNWITNFIIVEITPIDIQTLGWRFWIVWTVTNTLFLPVIYFFYPETSNRKLEDMDAHFRENPSIIVIKDEGATMAKRPEKYILQDQEDVQRQEGIGSEKVLSACNWGIHLAASQSITSQTANPHEKRQPRGLTRPYEGNPTERDDYLRKYIEREKLPAAMPQDMPPRGGYEPVQYKGDKTNSEQRNLPAKGFRPGILLLGMGAVMSYGWYKLIGGMREANELGREKMWARINLIPLLQAEEDRDQVRRYLADQKREKELLGDNAKVYNSDRFVRPTFAVTPPPTTN
ncbi:Ff.00g018270.m01.CDS01 [Fusarium sp. VM40]|nr:Ff.00g018270.m01.CDS01 [Fusarium sp. VM40]